MRNLALMAAFGAAATLTMPLVQPAAAAAIQPAGIGAALDTTKLAEPVHCVPGYPHHSSFRYPDGCEPRSHRRGYRSYGYAPYYYPGPAYGYYAPGISFGFSTGPRRHWHHHHRRR